MAFFAESLDRAEMYTVYIYVYAMYSVYIYIHIYICRCLQKDVMKSDLMWKHLWEKVRT